MEQTVTIKTDYNFRSLHQELKRQSSIYFSRDLAVSTVRYWIQELGIALDHRGFYSDQDLKILISYLRFSQGTRSLKKFRDTTDYQEYLRG